MNSSDQFDHGGETVIPCDVVDAIHSWRRVLDGANDGKAALYGRACRELIQFRHQLKDEHVRRYIVDELHHLARANGIEDEEAAEVVAAAQQPSGAAAHNDVLDEGVAEKRSSGLSITKPSDWAGQPVPERHWLVLNRIPMGNVTILNGDGAAGKTTIALQLVEATVSGADWLHSIIDHPGKAIFFTGEEDHDEIHRRFASIAAHRGKDLAELADIELICRPDEDAVLGQADRAGRVQPTQLYNKLLLHAVERSPSLIVIEAAADVFSGNENDRAQVRQFIALLRRLAIRSGAAVMLLAHPSLSGLNSGKGTSGSTAWNNSSRSRLYFTISEKADEDREKDVRELRIMKSNYGPPGEVVRLRWQNGVFVPVSSMASYERVKVEAEIDEVYLKCLDAMHASGRDVSSLKNAPTYGPTEFVRMPQAGGCRKKALEAAQERLFAAGRIEVREVGPPSRRRKYICRKTGP